MARSGLHPRVQSQPVRPVQARPCTARPCLVVSEPHPSVRCVRQYTPPGGLSRV